MKYDLITFDIDGTLTRSKLPLDEKMADLIYQLLDKYKVAIISGAGFEQFKWQILDKLEESKKFENLYLLPADGTVYCTYQDDWQCQEDPALSEDDKGKIKQAFEDIYEKTGLDKPTKTYGEVVEDRGAQMNFSALGQEAPIEEKERWDPDTKKREAMVSVLREALPGFSLHIGGTTSIEITREGIDKAYGMNKLMDKTGISKEKILYVGDKLSKGGNDEPVVTLGIESEAVESLEDTQNVVLSLLNQ